MKFNIKNVISYVPLAMGISPFGSNFMNHNIKFQGLLVGLLFLFIYDKNIRKLVIYNLKNNHFISCFVFVVIMAIVGCLTGDSILYVFTDFLAIISFSFFYFFVTRNNTESELLEKFALKLCWTITLFEVICIYFDLYTGETEEARYINLAICPYFLCLLYLSKSKIIISLVPLALLLYICIMSALRINFLFVFMLLFYYILYIITNKSIGILKKLVPIFIMTVSISFAFPIAKAYWDNNPFLYANGVDRMLAIFINDNTFDDNTRKDSNEIIFREVQDFILPQGIGWQNHTQAIQKRYKQYEVLSTMDSNVFYCIYHFGLFLGLFVLYNVVRKQCALIRESIRYLHGKCFFDINCYILITIISMFLIKSWIFTYMSFALIYGLLFAVCNNKIRQYNKRINYED